jgi:hypothetical protein
MSYLLASDRDWARRISVVAVAGIGIVLGVQHAISAVGPMHVTHVTPEQAEVFRLSGRLEELSAFISILGITTFGLLFLIHPDVVRTFRRRSREHNEV